jgi:hypothetical protein
MEGDLGAELLSDAVEEETSAPEVVAHCGLLETDFSTMQTEGTHVQCLRRDRPGTPTGRA